MARFNSILMLSMFLITSIEGQDTLSKRPTVGLVLSGGAAKGLSQIGVLKILESEGIYPDIITGTSMGGIIGGMYSIGYSAHELDSILRTTDWNYTFNDNILLNRVAITEKRDYNDNMLKLQFDLDHKPSFPMAFMQGQHITEKLGELTWHAAGIDNFDSLNYRYRATAVDLVRSELHYFSGVDLKTAIRSTLAIPSVFSPVVLDSMLLVDGGVLCSFPVEEAKRLGADYTIGVYNSYNERIERGDIYSMLRVLSRSSFINGVCDSKKQLNEIDILIRPDLKDHGPESFLKAIEIMNIGEQAATEKLDTLKKFAALLKQFPDPERRSIPRIDSFYIVQLGAEGNSRIKEQFITARSGLVAESWIKYRDVNEAVQKIYGTLNFDNVDYYLQKREEGYALIFRVVEKKAGLLSVGAHYDNDFRTGIVLEALYRNLLISADRIHAGVNISQNSQVRADYNIYFGKRKRNFATLWAEGENNNLPHYFTIDTLISDYGKIRHNLWEVDIGIGTMIGRNSAFIIKGLYEWSDYRFLEGLEEMYGMENIKTGAFRAGAEYHLNTMDRGYFPEAGMKFDAEADFVFADPENYMKFYGSYDHMIRLHRIFSAGLQARFGVIEGIPLMYDQFYLGGDHFNPRKNMVNMLGWDIYKLNVDDFFSFGMTFQFNIRKDFYVIFRGNIINLENFQGPGHDASNNSYGYGTSLGYRSVIGPIKLSLFANSREPGLQWFFNFSFPF